MLCIALLLQGCTNSKLVIGPLYNRLDDRIRNQFDKLGDFTDQQTAAFEATLGTFHVWHRQSELPQYAELLKTVAGSIAEGDTNQDDVQRWFATAENHSLLVRQCHPINYLFELMKSLSDDELNLIEKRFKREQLKNRVKYANTTSQERVERRLRNMTKWAGRIGLEFTPTQRAMLLGTLKNQTSMRKEYYALSREWNRRFFSLARAQSNPDYARDMGKHLDELWHLLERAYPSQWQANRDLWKETSLRFAQSMTDEQRDTTSRWLDKMGSTLAQIARDEPSFKVVNDPALGCLVDSEGA